MPHNRQSAIGNRQSPNILFVIMDDMGFGDTNCYGPSKMNTPNMKRIADEGIRFTRMYTAPICSPARAQFLTGKYAQRVDVPRVLFPDDTIGLKSEGRSIAACLKEAGYATLAIGKWHVGCQPEHYPTRHGFDHFFGPLYSNDMRNFRLFRDEEVEEPEVDQSTLTRKYSEEAIKFIETNKDQPFFCYLAHTMPHVPLHIDDEHKGISKCGLYGDTIECIDDYLGRILAKLEELDILDNTLVIVTSDNGPWFEGSPGATRGRKFDVYEGGIRVPFMARLPGTIPAGTTCTEPGHLIDMLPTFMSLAGGEAPDDLDGVDISNLFRGEGTSPHEYIYLYKGNALEGIIKGDWKLHTKCQRGEFMQDREYPKLHNVADDMDESYCLKTRHPELVEELTSAIQEFDEKMKPFYIDTPRPGKKKKG